MRESEGKSSVDSCPDSIVRELTHDCLCSLPLKEKTYWFLMTKYKIKL